MIHVLIREYDTTNVWMPDPFISCIANVMSSLNSSHPLKFYQIVRLRNKSTQVFARMTGRRCLRNYWLSLRSSSQVVFMEICNLFEVIKIDPLGCNTWPRNRNFFVKNIPIAHQINISNCKGLKILFLLFSRFVKHSSDHYEWCKPWKCRIETAYNRRVLGYGPLRIVLHRIRFCEQSEIVRSCRAGEFLEC